MGGHGDRGDRGDRGGGHYRCCYATLTKKARLLVS